MFASCQKVLRDFLSVLPLKVYPNMGQLNKRNQYTVHLFCVLVETTIEPEINYEMTNHVVK